MLTALLLLMVGATMPALQDVATSGGGIDPVGALAGLASVFLTGVIRKATGKADERILNFIKPVQPAIALGLSLAIPYVTQHLGLTPVDPQAFAQAPASTLAFLTLREAYVRLRPKS